MTYAFDVLGNLKSRWDESSGNNLYESFDYDLLNRIERVMLSSNGQFGTQTPTLSLTYNAAGNILTKSDVSGTYGYGTLTTRPHAVTCVGGTTGCAGGVTYTYDANGNNTSSTDGRSITYEVFDQAKRIQKGSEYTEFSYGVGNGRIKRVDANPIDASTGTKTTWYFGTVERIQVGSGNAFFKRYIGDNAIADYFPSTQEQDVYYLIKDHLGSIHNVTNESGLLSSAQWMHFGAFGGRQNSTWDGALSPAGMMLQNLYTTHGFTGHEHADGLGIIHMNGRIYDPRLGRFLQADPFVQDPKNSQSLNRYTYVYNNPLSYTDPSGYFSLKSFWKKIRPFVAIAISIYMPQFTALWQAMGVAGNAVAIGFVTGGVAGFVASGNITGALAGAFAGGAFGALGGWNPAKALAKAGKVLAHGAVGGMQNLLQGGRFGHGFLSAGFTQSLAGPIGRIQRTELRVVAAAIAAGTISELTGGKFANGALTGAFSRALNEESSARMRNTEIRSLTKNQAQALSEAAQAYHKEIDNLTTDQMLERFPELEGFIADFGRDEAAQYGKEILHQELTGIISLSTAKFISAHIMDNFDSLLSDVLIGAPIGHFYKAAGYAWDIYSYTQTNWFLASDINVIFACNLNSGCQYAVE